MFFQKAFYCLSLVFLLKNWPEVLRSFLLKEEKERFFLLRNGLKIKYYQWINLESLIGVFVKKNYGNLRDKSVIIDIGANIGCFSIFAAAFFKENKVLAFEPEEKAFKILCENIEINRVGSKIKVFKKGVAGWKGKRKFFLSKFSPLHSLYGYGGGRKFLEIDCLSLKDIFEENKLEVCDLLKIDAEGAEYEILYQTPEEYFKKIREIRLEYHLFPNLDTRGEPENLINFLKKKNFEVKFFRRDAKTSGIIWFSHSTIKT